MRILHIVPTYYPAIRYGGTIFSVHELASGLASLGHHVEVFTTNRDGHATSPVPVGTPVSLDGVAVTYFSAGLFPRLYVAPAMGAAIQARVRDFDILMLHSVFLWPTTIAARAARAAGVPYIVHPHGMLVKSLVTSRSRLLKNAWIGLFERVNYERAAAVRVMSALEKEELERFGWRLDRILTIPNSAREAKPYRQADVANDVLDIVRNQPLILYLGRLSWKKGIDRLIQGMRHVSLGHLAIVGPSDEDLMPDLSKQAEEAGVAHRVSFLARAVSGADKEHLFRAATVFALTSHNENFGNTILEAMARAVPVVVTSRTGASEVVRAAGAGLIVEGDPGEIGRAIDRIVSDPTLRQSLANAGEVFCRLHCSRAAMAGTMAAEMETIVSASRPAERGLSI